MTWLDRAWGLQRRIDASCASLARTVRRTSNHLPRPYSRDFTVLLVFVALSTFTLAIHVLSPVVPP